MMFDLHAHTVEIFVFSFCIALINAWIIKALRQTMKTQDDMIEILQHMKSVMTNFENDSLRMEQDLNSRLNSLQQARFSPSMTKVINQNKEKESAS